MSAKWVVLWNLPPGSDIDSWERWYWEQHVPLAKQLPGMIRYTTTRVVRTVYGMPYYRMAEQYFPTTELLDAAIGSPVGKAVADDAGPYVSDLVLIVSEEDDVPL